MESDNALSLIVIGAPDVGKTSVTNKFTKNEFTEKKRMTIGVDFAVKSIQLEGNNLQVKIFDPAGQEKYRAYTPQYFRRIEGIVVLFSLVDRASFQMITEYWIAEIDKYIDINQIPKILCGNKCDYQNRQVTSEEVKELANNYKMEYFETSAKDGTNIAEAFEDIINQAYRYKQKLCGSGISIIRPESMDEENKKKCCK